MGRRRKNMKTDEKQSWPNELGLYDMSGNVYEWCRDLYGDYPEESVTDPTGVSYNALQPFCESHVIHGGGWRTVALDCRLANRAYANPSYSDSDLGFRVALVPVQ